MSVSIVRIHSLAEHDASDAGNQQGPQPFAGSGLGYFTKDGQKSKTSTYGTIQQALSNGLQRLAERRSAGIVKKMARLGGVMIIFRDEQASKPISVLSFVI